MLGYTSPCFGGVSTYGYSLAAGPSQPHSALRSVSEGGGVPACHTGTAVCRDIRSPPLWGMASL